MHTRIVSALLAGAALAVSPCASAEEERIGEHKVELGARLGFSLPMGVIENGSRASDLTYGSVPIAFDGGLALSQVVSVGALFLYAPTIPKLCASASDCTSSLGHDILLGVLSRFHFPRMRWLCPDAEVGVGYEWASRSLADKGANSTRSFRGPRFTFAVVPIVPISKRFSLGLAIGASLAIASNVNLDAPGISESRAADGTRVHGSIDFAVRVGSWL